MIAEQRPPTPTEIAAHTRRVEFRRKIAERAASLAGELTHSLAYPAMSTIATKVASYYSVTVFDIKSARRTAEIMRPRQTTMYLCRHLTPFSLPSIGRFIGGRNHATIICGVRKITKLIETDPRLAFEIALLTRQLGGAPL